MTAATAPGTMCARSARFRPARAVRGGSCATRRADHHQDVRSVSSSRQRPGLNLMPQSSPAQAPHRRSSQWHHERHLRRLVRVRPGSSRRSPHITFKRQLICAHTAADMRKVESELIVHWGRRCCGALCSRIVRAACASALPCESKLTSSGKRGLQPTRNWCCESTGFQCTIPPPSRVASPHVRGVGRKGRKRFRVATRPRWSVRRTS